MDIQIWSVPGSADGLVGQILKAEGLEYDYYSSYPHKVKEKLDTSARIIIALPELDIIRRYWKLRHIAADTPSRRAEIWQGVWQGLAIVHAAALNTVVVVDPLVCWQKVVGSPPDLKGAPPENWKVSMIHDSLRSKIA